MNNNIYEEVITIDNNSQLRVSLRLYKGKEYVVIRLFMLNQKGDYYPTKVGINLPSTNWKWTKEALETIGKVSESLRRYTRILNESEQTPSNDETESEDKLSKEQSIKKENN